MRHQTDIEWFTKYTSLFVQGLINFSFISLLFLWSTIKFDLYLYALFRWKLKVLEILERKRNSISWNLSIYFCLTAGLGMWSKQPWGDSCLIVTASCPFSPVIASPQDDIVESEKVVNIVNNLPKQNNGLEKNACSLDAQQSVPKHMRKWSHIAESHRHPYMTLSEWCVAASVSV